MFAGRSRLTFSKKKNSTTRKTGAPMRYAGQRRHLRARYHAPKNTAAASTPHSMAGALADCVPERPALASTFVVMGGGGGASVAGPMRRETTMRRWAALKRGVHVVSVSRLSGVGLSTATSLGLTFIEWST